MEYRGLQHVHRKFKAINVFVWGLALPRSPTGRDRPSPSGRMCIGAVGKALMEATGLTRYKAGPFL